MATWFSLNGYGEHLGTWSRTANPNSWPDPRFDPYTAYDFPVVTAEANVSAGNGAAFTTDTILEAGGTYVTRVQPYYAGPMTKTLGLDGHYTTELAVLEASGYSGDIVPTVRNLGNPESIDVERDNSITDTGFLLYTLATLDPTNFIPKVYRGNTNLSMVAIVDAYDQINAFSYQQATPPYRDPGLYRGYVVADRVRIIASGPGTGTKQKQLLGYGYRPAEGLSLTDLILSAATIVLYGVP